MIDLANKNPVNWLLAGVSAVVGGLVALLGGIDPALAFLSSTSGLWFPIGSVTGGVILPKLGLETWGTRLALTVALAYVTLKGATLIERGAERLQER